MELELPLARLRFIWLPTFHLMRVLYQTTTTMPKTFRMLRNPRNCFRNGRPRSREAREYFGAVTNANNKTTMMTVAPVQPGIMDGLVQPSQAHRPEFIRLPRAGARCPWSSLARGKMNQLVLPSALNGFKPPVQSFSMRNRGQVRATRLIVLESLLAYLHRLCAEQTGETGKSFSVKTSTSCSEASAEDPSGNQKGGEKEWKLI